MSQVTQVFKAKIVIPIAVVVLAVTGGGVWWHEAHTDNVHTVTNTQHQLIQISYKGEGGVNAFKLLQKHAAVQYKKYSFGDLVTSINGVKGDGPKYWTLYVNGKESNVGASDYVTKSSDTITWKLQ